MNIVSLGIFAWTALEPEEGRYTFNWLDEAITQQLARRYGSHPAIRL